MLALLRFQSLTALQQLCDCHPAVFSQDTKSYQNKAPLPTETAAKITDEDELSCDLLVFFGSPNSMLRSTLLRQHACVLNSLQDVLAEEERCKQESDTKDAARYQELSHTYRVANTGARPSVSWKHLVFDDHMSEINIQHLCRTCLVRSFNHTWINHES